MSDGSQRLLYLNREEVTSLLPCVDDQLDLIERVFGAIARGRVEMPPKPGIHPREDAFIHAMPAYLADDDVAAIKWVSGYPSNGELGLPYISALIVLNDAATGLPYAVMDGSEITAARTAAASGACIRRWAPDDWDTVAMLGCGEQGRHHSRVISALNPDASILAYDPETERARSLPGKVTSVGDPREACEVADVIITTGPIVDDPKPAMTPAWLGERWLLLPVDFDFYVRHETIRAAELFVVDDIAQYAYYGDQRHFRNWPTPDGSVGQALDRDSVPARVACVNLGLGAVDAAFAAAVHRVAADEDVGTELTR